MANERTYPCLPCADLDESVAFYAALGFTRVPVELRGDPLEFVRGLAHGFRRPPCRGVASSDRSLTMMTSSRSRGHVSRAMDSRQRRILCSSLRAAMMQQSDLGERTEMLGHSYKELEIPPAFMAALNGRFSRKIRRAPGSPVRQNGRSSPPC